MQRDRWLLVIAAFIGFLLAASSGLATKYEIWKPAAVNPATGGVDHPSVALDWLADHGAVVLAEYPTTILIESPEAERDALLAAAAARGIAIRARDEFDRIDINGYRFESTSLPQIVDPELHLADYDAPAGLYIVQFIGPNRREWEQALQGFASVIHYYPENTYVVKMSPEFHGAVASLEHVQHVSVYQPAFKVQPIVLTMAGVQALVVQMDTELALATTNAMIRQLLQSAAVPAGDLGPLLSIRAELTLDQVIDLARQPEVVWIEPSLIGTFSDERQANVVAGKHNGSQPTNPSTYHTWLASKGFCTSTSSPPGCYSYSTRVGVFDTGIDKNICSVDGGTCLAVGDTHIRHVDLGDREKYFFCGTTTGCLDNLRYNYSDEMRHGTKAASVIAGDPQVGTGQRDDGNFFLGTGIAPLAEIVTVRLGRVWWFKDYTPGDFQILVNKVRQKAARFINNSWNYDAGLSDEPLGYTIYSQKFDELVRDASGGFNQFDHPMTIVFSAGNHDGDPDGDENENLWNPYHYVEAPGNAKNVISVGSSESYRTSGFECPPPPDPSFPATNIKNIAEYSLRGVKYDPNRFKPDLTAPSTRIAAAQSRYLPYPENGYEAFCGTSAAAPVVTGAAVLAETWYKYNNGSVLPSPAMVKAMLAARAEDLYGGYDNYAQASLPHFPSLAQGWGRVNLNRLFQSAVGVRFFDEDHTTQGPRRFTAGEGSWTVNLTVDNPSYPVIVALAFTDRFAAAGAYLLKVNNLDVYVIDGSYSYQGNDFKADGYTYRATSHWLPDEDNTVELIRVPAGEIVNGDFTVEVVPAVSAKAVPGLDGTGANQDFALYVYNAN